MKICKNKEVEIHKSTASLTLQLKMPLKELRIVNPAQFGTADTSMIVFIPSARSATTHMTGQGHGGM